MRHWGDEPGRTVSEQLEESLKQVRLLLCSGADAFAVNDAQESPLTLAGAPIHFVIGTAPEELGYCSAQPLTDVLTEFRLPIVLDCDDWTQPYFFANLSVAEIQFCYDAWTTDPASPAGLYDQTGRTPLHYAAYFVRDPAIIAVLLGGGSGFDPARKDALGFTPLDYGRVYNHRNVPVLDLLQRP